MTSSFVFKSGTRLLHAHGDDSSSAEYERDHLAAVQAEEIDTVALAKASPSIPPTGKSTTPATWLAPGTSPPNSRHSMKG
jgi:hypothetical protein